MPYATRQEMIDRFGEAELIQLTDRAEPLTNAIVDSVLDAALADADSEINGYLQARYSLPLATVPLLVQKLSRTIARYNLYDKFAPEKIEKDYNQAMSTLKLISNGGVQLGLDEAGGSTPSTAAPETQADAAVFTPATLSNYH